MDAITQQSTAWTILPLPYKEVVAGLKSSSQLYCNNLGEKIRKKTGATQWEDLSQIWCLWDLLH